MAVVGKISTAIFQITALIVALVFLTLAFWAGDRAPAVKQLQFDPLNAPKPGEILKVQETLDRARMNCDIWLMYIIIDSEGKRQLIPTHLPISPGDIGRDAFITEIPIREDAKPGNAELRMFKSHACNPIHYIWPLHDAERTVRFKISPK